LVRAWSLLKESLSYALIDDDCDLRNPHFLHYKLLKIYVILFNKILIIFKNITLSMLISLIHGLYLIKRQGGSIAKVFGFIENLGVGYTVCLGGKSILFLHIIHSY